MTFKEFARMLSPILSGGNNTADYSRELISNITEIPHTIEDNPLITLSDSAWIKYVSGDRCIKKTAQIINQYINDEKFVTYIDNLSDGARYNICEKLKFKYPDVNNFNVGEICASLFKSILQKSAEGTTIEKIDKEMLNKKFGLSLLIESNFTCANHNCCEYLYIIERDTAIPNYETTVIDPSIMDESFDNLIALCPKCSKKYDLAINKESMKNLKDIKDKFMKKSDIKETLSNSKPDLEIKRIIRKIQNVNHNELEELDYSSISVDKNLIKENALLLKKIAFYITTYYKYVNNLFNQLEKDGELKFKIFCVQIQLVYKDLVNNKLPHSKIYECLVELLMNSTHEDREPCEIIVSYFLYNFEVVNCV